MKTTSNLFPYEDLNEDTGFLLLQVSRLWLEQHETVLKKRYGLAFMQCAVLVSVYWLAMRHKKEVTQTILANHTKIDPMTISQIFKLLESKGYIYRQKHSVNVRAKAVFLTEQGTELVGRIIPSIMGVNDRFFKGLGKSHDRFNDYMMTLLKTNDLAYD